MYTDDTTNPTNPDTPEDLTPQQAEANELEELRAELATTKDQLLRAVADAENTRRIAAQDVERAKERTQERAIAPLLPVADVLAASEAALTDDIATHPYVAGMRGIAQLLGKYFAEQGVQQLSPLGEAFSADEHQAMGTAPGAAGIIITVLQPGYRLQGRLLRPAMVIIGQGEDAAAPAAQPAADTPAVAPAADADAPAPAQTADATPADIPPANTEPA